jgi:hypothetical protein
VLGCVLSSVGDACASILAESRLSLLACVGVLAGCLGFVSAQEIKLPLRTRLLLGLGHGSLHIFLAVALAVCLDLAVAIGVKHGGLGADGSHSLFRWFSQQEQRLFPDENGLRFWLERVTLGLYPACIKWAMFLFDVPEALAVAQLSLCGGGAGAGAAAPTQPAAPRADALVYHFAFVVYYLPLAAVASSIVVGLFLGLCTNVFLCMWNDGFSSLRIEHHKSFLRFHITREGDLEMFCIGIDEVPSRWRRNPAWRPLSEVARRLGIGEAAERASEPAASEPAASEPAASEPAASEPAARVGDEAGSDACVEAGGKAMRPVPLAHMLRHPSRWLPVFDKDKRVRRARDPAPRRSVPSELEVRLVDYAVFRKHSAQTQ